MYNEYFGLEESPFSIAPDPRFLYMSDMHRDALAHLIFGVKSDGGFVLLTGEVGTGKTTVCRCLLELIPKNVDVAFVLNPKVTAMELLATICDELGIDYPKNNTSIKFFVDQINAYLLDCYAKDRKTVLLIDEAQNLEADVLEQIRLLTNLETSKRKLLQIIMIGQPELNDLLAKPELRQLSQRITARYHLKPLPNKDVAAYIDHRLKVAGQRTTIFSPSTIETIAFLSNGIPRMINVLCDRAMLGAYVEGHDQINREILRKAAQEILGETMPRKKSRSRVKNQDSFWAILVTAIAAVLFLTTAGSYYFMKFGQNSSPLRSESAAKQTIGPLTEIKEAAQETVPVDLTPLESPLPDPEGNSPATEFSWPEKVSTQASLHATFAKIFSLWDSTYLKNSKDSACIQAKSQGLSCMYKRGSLGSLRNLNRPAALKLKSAIGMEFYAPLIGLGTDTATIFIDGKSREVPIPELENYWDGSYILLWRLPFDFDGAIKPGDTGLGVLWVARQLAILDGKEVSDVKADAYDQELITRVKEFQRQAGLIPDGIIGSQTIIHLNSAVGIKAPVLIDIQPNY